MTILKLIRKQEVYSRNKKIISKSPDDTMSTAFELGSQIQGHCLIGLSGELGVGKTVFAKGLAKGLGVKELITSPTFLGISEYYSGKYPFIHMDFYKKAVSLNDINSYLKKNAVVLIEWVENFSLVFNQELKLDINVYIEYLKDKQGDFLNNERQISLCYTK